MGNQIAKHAGLEIDEDFPHQQRAWRTKRVIWVMMGLIILGGLLGFFGAGPMSNKTVSAPDGISVEFERWVRHTSSTHFNVQVPAGEGDVELSLNQDFLEKISIERIEPEPREMRLSGDRHTWIFSRTPEASRISVSYEPEGFGTITARIDAKSAGVVEFKQFIFP
jgi:hypothetical protein